MPTPCTVTGNLQTLTGNQIAQGRVNFQLTNIGTGNPVGISGTSLFPALTYSVLSAPDGSFSVALWGNDNITPSNTLYAVTFRDLQGNEVGPVLYSIVGPSANLNTLVAAGTISPPVIVSGAVLLNPSALQTITGFPLAAPAFQSPNANPALTGIVRLSSGDLIAWRNTANSGDVSIAARNGAAGNFPADTIQTVNGFGATYFASFSNNVAASGLVRLLSGDSINWRNNANSADVALAKNTNDALTFAGRVMPQVAAPLVDLTAQQANIPNTALFTPPVNGFYRVSFYIVVTQAATTSSTLPQCAMQYTDGDTSVGEFPVLTVTNTANTVGTVGVPNTSGTQLNHFFAKAGAQIFFSTAGYASVGATPMQYALHVRLEYLG